MANRTKYDDKDKNQTRRSMNFKHGKRKIAGDKNFLVEPYIFHCSGQT